MDTLDQHSIDTSVNTQLKLDWHLINTQSTSLTTVSEELDMNQLIVDQCMWVGWHSANYIFTNCWSSVNRVSVKISIKCQPSVDRDFSNSLIIYQVKTKKITTMKVWISRWNTVSRVWYNYYINQVAITMSAMGWSRVLIDAQPQILLGHMIQLIQMILSLTSPSILCLNLMILFFPNLI